MKYSKESEVTIFLGHSGFHGAEDKKRIKRRPSATKKIKKQSFLAF
jgi:hypothetical protein